MYIFPKINNNNMSKKKGEMYMKVKDCMCENVSCVKPETTLSDVAKMMQQQHVGCVPVCDTNKKNSGSNYRQRHSIKRSSM